MLERGDWVLSAELDPPHGLSAEVGLKNAAALRDAGVDCVDVGDSPMASVRMSAIAFAASVQQQTGLEAVIHFASRDRNLMALQSDLMGAHMLGLRSAIALSGDPPSLGKYEGASAVWDVKAEGLIGLIATLNRGLDSAGNELGALADFTIAAAANPNNPNPDAEIARLQQKADAGAHVFFTQPTFDAAAVERFAERAAAIGLPVIIGVMVLANARNASFMAANIPGIAVSDDIIERLNAAGDNAREVAIDLAQEFVEQMRPLGAGVYLIPTLGRLGGTIEVARRLRSS
jgi:5,10-methylenetetrahydrofolate reductase